MMSNIVPLTSHAATLSDVNVAWQPRDQTGAILKAPQRQLTAGAGDVTVVSQQQGGGDVTVTAPTTSHAATSSDVNVAWQPRDHTGAILTAPQQPTVSPTDITVPKVWPT